MNELPPDPRLTRLDAPGDHGPVRTIGPYRLIERIGAGGMGEVWLAEQRAPVQRRVALKLIRAGMDTADVLARFDSERQALALMEHPSIAKIFGAGDTPDGRPYFVMEHVSGIPITEHCRRARLPTRERLELMIQVCEAVQHAHQKAVIHRDLKPGNVLVSLQDGRAVPKIIDFGLAKALSHRLTEHTLHTELGMLVGTPEYGLRALETRERLLGPADPETLRSTELMGDIRYGQGRFAEAESLQRRTLDGRRQVLGAEDPETLKSMNKAAFALRALARYEESEKLYDASLALHRRVLGPENPQTMGVVNDLGFLYLKQDRGEEAERLHRANLEMRTRVLGPEHNGTLWSLYNVGWACMALGRLDEAAELFTRCLDARQRTLGRDHPDTLWTMHMQATVMAGQGRYEEARQLFLQTIEAWPRGFGPAHPEILLSQAGAAHAAYMLGDLTGSRQILERSLAARRIAGHDDEEQAQNAHELLRVVYEAGGWTEEGRALDRELLPVWRRVVEQNEASYSGHLGIALGLLDEGHAARPEAEEAFRHAERAVELTPESCICTRSASSALAVLALAHHVLGHAQEAVRLQREAIAKLSSDEKALRTHFEAKLARYAAVRRDP